MSTPKAVAEFTRRIAETWLPDFCHDPKRNLATTGFRHSSITIGEDDARDCMYAIDHGVVVDYGGGRYKAARSTAFEQLFWQGPRIRIPRPITLWREPVITFAALARLHRDHGWPADLLASQPRTWAFDLAVHQPTSPSSYRILGEVKKSAKEAETLLADLRQFTENGIVATSRGNSVQKWRALLLIQAPLLWIVGPCGLSHTFTVAYPKTDTAVLNPATLEALNYEAA